jgi:uncharacterized protein (UPF0332 family)
MAYCCGVRILISFDDCLKKGLIRKTAPSKEQALLSIDKSGKLLEEAKADLEDERFNSATVMAYLSILNSSKALLYRDGFREKSHACVTRYLEAKYSEKLSTEKINLLDHFRETRHDVQYDIEYMADNESSKQIVEFADEILHLIEEIINSK